MAALRRPHLAHVLILVACSSADPSAGGASIEGVLAIDDIDCHGQCAEQFVRSAAVASGVVWFARDRNDCAVQSSGGNNGGCGTWSAISHVETASFGADGGARAIASGPQANVPNGTIGQASGVGVTDDGSAVYFAYDDETSGSLVVRALSADGADAGTLSHAGTADVLGIAAEPRAAVVAVSSTASPGADSFEGDTRSNGGGSSTGALLRFDFGDGGVTSTPIGSGVATSFNSHLFAADATNVYWATPNAIEQAPRADITAQTSLATLDVSNAGSPVGLAVSGGVVAWSIVYGSPGCPAGGCDFTPTACHVYAAGAAIWDSTQSSAPSKGCLGLAIDATYAYFAIADWQTVACNNCGNGTTTQVVTTAIARVSLTGQANQQPKLVMLSNDRIFGPRRFLVDDTYVYGIDPAYVLRVPKTAFGP